MIAELILAFRENTQILSLLAFLACVFVIASAVFVRRVRKKLEPDQPRWPKFIVLIVSAGFVFLSVFSAVYSLKHLRTVDPIDAWLWSNEIYAKLMWSIVAFVIVQILSKISEYTLLKKTTDIEARYRMRRGIVWGRNLALGIALVVIWLGHLQNLSVFLGIIGAGVALSLQESILCIAGWALIVVRRPFDIGDRIEIEGKNGTVIGDVIDIRTFQTSLLEVGNWVHADQSTGRIVNVPNSFVFRGLTANYTKGFPFIWNELPILVTFDSDWKKAKEIILAQAMEEAEKIELEVQTKIRRMQRNYAIRYEHLQPTVYTAIADSGVLLTLRYLTPARNRRGTTHEIAESLLDEFAKHETIDFAYPSRTVYSVAVETKAGSRHYPPTEGRDL